MTPLIKTPGRAPVDKSSVAAAPVLDEIEMPGGVAKVTQEARRKAIRDNSEQKLKQLGEVRP